MTSYDQIDDEDQLHEMMSKVENFEERKKIRARIREIREKKLNDAKTEAKPAASASTPDSKSTSQKKSGDANKENIDKKDGAVEKAKEDDGKPKETTETTTVTSKDGKTTTVTTVQTITDKNETRIITTEVATKTMPDGGTSTKTSKRTKIIQNQMGFGGGMAAPGGLAPAGRGRGLTRSPSAIKQMLLQWAKAMTQEYSDKITITNFSSSWNNGIAFCALIHHFFPDAFDFDALDPKKRRHNFDLAFKTAEKMADIAPLLDTEDMMRMKNPDWKCVFTYVQSMYQKLQSHANNKAMPLPEKPAS